MLAPLIKSLCLPSNILVDVEVGERGVTEIEVGSTHSRVVEYGTILGLSVNVAVEVDPTCWFHPATAKKPLVLSTVGEGCWRLHTCIKKPAAFCIWIFTDPIDALYGALFMNDTDIL